MRFTEAPTIRRTPGRWTRDLLHQEVTCGSPSASVRAELNSFHDQAVLQPVHVLHCGMPLFTIETATT